MKKIHLLTLLVVLAAFVPSAQAQQRDPELPRDLHGFWFDRGDPGWAAVVFDHPSAMTGLVLAYDNLGVPTWAYGPDLICYREQPPFLNVICDGTLYRVTAPWFGSNFDTSQVRLQRTGEWHSYFTTPLFGGVGPHLDRELFLSYSMGNKVYTASGMKPMKIQVINPDAPFLWHDGRYSGLWNAPNEYGWGVGIFVTGNVLYGTLFVHGRDREPRWYVIAARASAYEERADPIFEGEVLETRGAGGQDARDGAVDVRQVGRVSIHFGEQPGGPASLSYSIDGVEVSKTIVRPAP